MHKDKELRSFLCFLSPPPVLGSINTLHIPHSVFPDHHYSLLQLKHQMVWTVDEQELSIINYIPRFPLHVFFIYTHIHTSTCIEILRYMKVSRRKTWYKEGYLAGLLVTPLSPLTTLTILQYSDKLRSTSNVLLSQKLSEQNNSEQNLAVLKGCAFSDN